MTNGEKMIWAATYAIVLHELVVSPAGNAPQMTVSEASRFAVGAAYEAVLAANQVTKDDLLVSATAQSALQEMLQVRGGTKS